jgi:hypothetical protein
MKRLMIMLALAGLAVAAIAQSPDTATVTISSKGFDVREVLHDLFTKAKKSYVMEQSPRIPLFLALEGVEFEEALQIVCQQAGLKTEIQNGIIYVSKDIRKAAAPPKKETAAPPIPEKPKGRLPESVLGKRITTRSEKADIRTLFTEFGRQAGIAIEVDPAVPGYKLDAYLINTSLKYALDQVTEAAGLKYRFTEDLSVQIFKPADLNRVTLIKG